ncbi:MAG TPA: 2-dehydropantoate 2-reductase [Gemmatimonadales bacterium]|jgi:2-dehydropantoate 2-reductase
MERLTFAVFGTGAVGGYFGGRLAEAGEDVRFIARGRHLAAISEGGLRISSVDGDLLVLPAPVTDDPAEVGPVDVVFVGVKAWQVPDAAVALRPLLGDQTFVLPLQNGIEAPYQLASVLGSDRVLGGLCRILAFLDGPGHIRHTGVTPYIAFGELDGSTSDRVEGLRRALARTRGVTVEVPDDIGIAMWSKFLFITALGGIGALTRSPIGVLRSEAKSRELLRQALEEIQAVAIGNRIALPAGTAERTLAYIDTLPPEGTASMQRDIMEGRPSELEAQVGAVVRFGERLGVAVPVHRMIYDTLLPLERKARAV